MLWENHVLVVEGLAQAVFTGPWNHFPGLVPTLPTVEKHLIQPPNTGLNQGRVMEAAISFKATLVGRGVIS